VQPAALAEAPSAAAAASAADKNISQAGALVLLSRDK